MPKTRTKFYSNDTWFFRFIVLSALALSLITLLLMNLNNNSTSKWKTYTSKRVPLSFQYPSSWPLSESDDRFISQFKGRAEAIDFANYYIPNARGDSFGYIIVVKADNIGTPEQYLKDKYSNLTHNAIVKQTKIGTENGFIFKIQQKDPTKNYGLDFFASDDGRYLIFKNGLIYEVALTNPTFMDSDAAVVRKIFQQMLSTFKFTR